MKISAAISPGLFVAIGILVLGCKESMQPEKSDRFDTIVHTLFLGMDRQKSYDSLCKYFKDDLRLAENQDKGWTSYPPLSALGNASDKRNGREYEISQYLNLSLQLQSASLSIQRSLEGDSAWSKIEIVLQFKSRAEAQLFFACCVSDLKPIKGYKEHNEFDFGQGVSAPDKAGKYFLDVYTSGVDQISLYNVTLLLVPDEYYN